jgi:SAM-dependent MidA family methyltransferase
MHWLRPGVRACLVLFTLFFIGSLPAADQRDELLNSWEIHNEIRVPASAAPAVQEFFLSFLEYQDLVLFHPTLGYYSSGRVDFTVDYRTFPDALYPYFGHMIAEHIFQMWDGMKNAGTLTAKDRFTIAEFGAGNGGLAESILDYIEGRAAEKSGEHWLEFWNQMIYACYDRSPALSATQGKRNSRFGPRFEAREGDATNPTATIPAGSLKGIILSNELPDAFSVHKVVLSPGRAAEVAFVAPALPAAGWDMLKAAMPAGLQERLKREDLSIQTRLFGNKRDPVVYLGRAGFAALLEALSSAPDYARKIDAIEFHEIYVPIETIPELADHLRKYAREYAYELARSGKGFVGYINLGEGRFIQGMGSILKSGYVITIDYGENWDAVPPLDYDHFRGFGPGSRSERADPYHAPTLNDMTTDVNFSHIAADGKLSALRPVFFGVQSALVTGTPVDLDTPPQDRDFDDYFEWRQNFSKWPEYKILVQQKENTDPYYSFPDRRAVPLEVKMENLTTKQQAQEAEIERRLRERLAGR